MPAEKFEKVMFMTSTSLDEGSFYVAFNARLTVGQTPHGLGLIVDYEDGQGEQTQGTFPHHTITSWTMCRTVSQRNNHRGVRLRVVVPLPPLVSGTSGGPTDWVLTFKTEGWQDFRRLQNACRASFPGEGGRS
jgi:hypothetical protein